jgi:hypothetical protein
MYSMSTFVKNGKVKKMVNINIDDYQYLQSKR